jgi:hypothetical protein
MSKDDIIRMADASGLSFYGMGKDREKFIYYLEAFAALVAAAEREAIVQMFEGAPALVQFAQNDKGGCLICGFTPKIAIETIRARGNT